MADSLNFEEYLNKNGRLIYTNVGVSMLPLLRQGKDLFIIENKSKERFKIGDVVLYRRNKQYVLHRIIEVREKDYVILGDNCVKKEYGIQDCDIIGIMTGFVRNRKEHSINELSYKVYSFIWLKINPLRIFMKQGFLFVKRLLKNE